MRMRTRGVVAEQLFLFSAHAGSTVLVRGKDIDEGRQTHGMS